MENQNQHEAKTIVNGKLVSLSEAQQILKQASERAQQTGVQEHHSNHSEAVQAGQTATNAANVQAEQLNIKQGNLQSGQGHLDAGVQQNSPIEEMAKAAAAKAKTKKAD